MYFNKSFNKNKKQEKKKKAIKSINNEKILLINQCLKEDDFFVFKKDMKKIKNDLKKGKFEWQRENFKPWLNELKPLNNSNPDPYKLYLYNAELFNRRWDFEFLDNLVENYTTKNI